MKAYNRNRRQKTRDILSEAADEADYWGYWKPDFWNITDADYRTQDECLWCDFCSGGEVDGLYYEDPKNPDWFVLEEGNTPFEDILHYRPGNYIPMSRCIFY